MTTETNNKKIRIVTDSVCDIPPEMLADLDIPVIPCFVNYDNDSLADDGKELDRDKFYNDIANMKEFPTTAAPPPALAGDILKEALEGYDHVVCINVAEPLSGTYNNCYIAAQNLMEEGEVPQGSITVVNSESVSMGIGWQVLAAHRAAQQTGDLDKVLAAAKDVRENHSLYAAIASMDFLRRSGRISGVVASVGSLLKIKPIIEVLEEGRVEATHRIRTFSKAKDKLRDLLIAEGEVERIAILHTQNPEGAQEFIDNNKDLMPEEVLICAVGPTLGTHIGLGSVGFVSVRKH